MAPTRVMLQARAASSTLCRAAVAATVWVPAGENVESAGGGEGFVHDTVPPPVLPLDCCCSLLSSWRIESRCWTSFAFSVEPRVDCRPVISPMIMSRMLFRRATRRLIVVPVGRAPPNAVVKADRGDPMVDMQLLLSLPL